MPCDCMFVSDTGTWFASGNLFDGSVAGMSCSWETLSWSGFGSACMCDFSTWADGGIVKCNLTGALPVTVIFGFPALADGSVDVDFFNDSFEAWLCTKFKFDSLLRLI